MFYVTSHMRERKVGRDYDGEAAEALELNDNEKLKAMKDQIRARALAFLSRKSVAPKGRSAKNKRYRVKSRNKMLRVDCGMQMNCGYGLKAYIQDKDIAKRDPDPEKWWRMSVCRDEGSDELCWASFAKWVLNVNLDDIIDFNHGSHSSLRVTYHDVDAWPHLLLYAIACGVDYGPYNEDRFYRSIIEAFDEYLNICDPDVCPLWADSIFDILKSRGELHRLGEPGIQRTVFQATRLAISDLF